MVWFRKSGHSGHHAGLSVTDAGVAVVRLAMPEGGSPVLAGCGFAPAGSGSVPDSAQRLVDQVSARRATACAVMNTGDYRLLLVEAPDLPPEEMRAAVRWRIRDLVDFPVENAVVDVFDIPEQARRGQSPMIYAVVAPADAVAAQVALVEESGLALEALDIPELCLRNVATMLPEDDAGVALLYLAEDHGVLTLTRQGVLYLVRRLEIGLEDIRDTLAGDTLTTDANSAVALEVQRSLDYFESHYDQRPVTNVVVTPNEQADSVAAYLGRELGTSARCLDLNELLPGGDPVAPDVQGKVLLAAGAALRPAAAQARAAA